MITRLSGVYAFLSNFYLRNVVYEGKRYPSAEHAFQAAKTLDENWREVIRLAETPGHAKRIGRRIELRTGWDEMRLRVMAEILAIKFAEGTPLAERLLATWPNKIVEGNNWGDKYWGVVDGVGENHLGKLLMERRGILRER